MTDRARSQIQAAEMGFLRRVAGRTWVRVRHWGEELSHQGGARSRAAAAPHQEGSAEDFLAVVIKYSYLSCAILQLRRSAFVNWYSRDCYGADETYLSCGMTMRLFGVEPFLVGFEMCVFV